MDSVLHYLQPGVSTLNWSSMNIDAYLHQVHSANTRLKDVVDSVKEVVSEGIEKKIEEIRRVILFDKQLATAHVWSIEKFVEEESKAVSQQGRRVHEMVKEVENALQVKEEYLIVLYFFRGFINVFSQRATDFSQAGKTF